jgi:hypothetical protein
MKRDWEAEMKKELEQAAEDALKVFAGMRGLKVDLGEDFLAEIERMFAGSPATQK